VAEPAVPTLSLLALMLFLSWLHLRVGIGHPLLGGAYTAIPFPRRDADEQGAWMTDAQFLDGLGLAGTLPPPLVIFANFVGWLGAGLALLR
jgi:chromate transporter